VLAEAELPRLCSDFVGKAPRRHLADRRQQPEELRAPHAGRRRRLLRLQ
jgi:hypothetical protein